MTTITAEETELLDLSNISPARIQEMEPRLLIEYLDRIPLVEDQIARIKERAKAMLAEDEHALLDVYYLKAGAHTRSLRNVPVAVQRILAASDLVGDGPLVQPNELLSKAKFSLTDLDKLVKEKSGLKMDDAKAHLATILGDTIVHGQNAPSLARREDA